MCIQIFYIWDNTSVGWGPARASYLECDPDVDDDYSMFFPFVVMITFLVYRFFSQVDTESPSSSLFLTFNLL